jgi:DNA modification methylase
LIRLLHGDCREVLVGLKDNSVHCVVTSPPYWGLRDYGVGGQIGLEATPAEYVETMVAVFREVRRVLRADGTVWVNLGDSYAAGGRGGGADGSKQQTNVGALLDRKVTPAWFKAKDLCGIPWRVAFTLQADGWYLRQDIIWSKPNPMPESVRDRCTKAHEYIFLLSRSERYYYDQDAIREPYSEASISRFDYKLQQSTSPGRHKPNNNDRRYEETHIRPPNENGRNKRSVWEVATAPFSEAHFATFPPALIEPCILAGCPKGGTVLDPFGGAGTTGLVADRLGRDAILVELNEEYAAMARRRIADDAGMFAEII